MFCVPYLPLNFLILYHISTRKSIVYNTYNRHYEKIGNSEPKCIDDELPFDIPNSWEWVRLGNYALYVFSGKSPKYSKIPTAHKVIGQQANQWNGVNLRYIKYCTDDFVVDMPKSYYLQDGDVLLNTLGNGTLGRSGIFNKSICAELILTDGHLFVFRNYNKVLSQFLLIFLQMKYDEIVKSANGSTNQTFLNLTRTLQWLVPVPPLPEQERLVAEIERYEPLLAEYDKLERQKSKLDSEIYDKLKKSILQYAIQGKLVSQDENDEPASVLLEKIRAEKKAQLGKKHVESYIYKGDDNCYYEKVGSKVKNITEEIPFDIPENWEWTRINTFINFSKNETVRANEIPVNSWILDLEDIEKDSGKILCKKRFEQITAKSDKHKFRIGDVLYSKLRPYLNKVVVADEDGYCTTEILVFDFSKYLLNHYAQIFLMSPYFVNYAMSGAYGVKMPRIGSERGNNALIPVPPYNEQIRIVKAVNKLKKIIDKDKI